MVPNKGLVLLSDRLRKCCDPTIALRALSVAIVVRSILNFINHYDLLLGKSLTCQAMIQMGLTYVVPYVVSTHGQVWWRKSSAIGNVV